MNFLDIKLDDPKAMPLRAHDTDAGADLFSKSSVVIYPNNMALVDTGVSVKIPRGYVGIVVPRSSQGKVKVYIANTLGVIDSDYRGNIMIRLVNGGVEPYEVNAYATRIAQLIIIPISLPQFRVFDPNVMGLWDDTARSTGAFGSTGV